MDTFFVEQFIVKSENPGVTDLIKELEPGVFEWTRVIPVTQEEGQDFQRLVMTLCIPGPVQFFMIPGVTYHGNQWGGGMEPKGMGKGQKPWKFGSHRSGIPGGMYAQNEEASFGMWGEPENPMGFCCFLEETEAGGILMNLQFPEEEGPAIYCARDTYENTVFREPFLFSGKEIRLKVMLVLHERERAYDYHFFLDAAWKYLKEKSDPIRTRREAMDLGMEFIRESAFFRQGDFSGFCMGLTWSQGKWIQKRDYLEIGWVGQNASLAVSLLYQYAIVKDKEALDLGLEILDCWAFRAVLPNGLFRCRFDRILKYGKHSEQEEERNDAANLYSVVEEYLEAYRLLKRFGIERERYRELALGICDFMVGVQKPNGKLGKAWYNNGVCSDTEGTSGCYMARALCIAYRETGDSVYLKAAEKGYRYYYGEFMVYGYTMAGALDTCCVDKESAIPLLGAALCLYEFTSQVSYLEEAVRCGYYLVTWQYHYNVKYPEDTLLGRMHYKTGGGTAVSVQHHHIDCYGLAFYEDFYQLSRITGNPLWQERAEAIWNNSLYNISDGDLIINGQKRPRGSQDEGFLQTRWHTKRGEYFGVSQWLVVWNTAFRLKILRKEYDIQ